ncbi:hypothetical protein GR226_04150 [Rhizobium leguminosarum]|uniref:hypothetical protein n=1 Tax=Rhizobium ruizarguesonis TaxID=2081791 RepID=UPI0013DB33F2|nr:hypothetical protein [Rhizobium ruizarguesonis]NEH82929.1 hypothetical protein [Rhizobium ruizarguesonis]
MRLLATIFCAFISYLLQSCTSIPTSVDQNFTAQKVSSHSNSSRAILDALSADAGYGKGSADFYGIAEAGFNFVDSQCDGYFQSLHELEHRRSAAVRGIGAFGQTINAVLAVTGANAVSIAVTAQAFGLGQNLANVYADTFLFSLPPSKTEQFVAKVMGAYRNAAAAHRASIASGPEAYHEIQGYVRLCTPVTIEAMLTDHIADATAEAVYGPGNTDVLVGTRTSAQQKVALERTAPIASATRKFPERTRVVDAGTPGAINSDEANIPPKQLRTIQSMVCVPATGVWDSGTRQAIAGLFTALGDSRPRITSLGVTKIDLPTLQIGLATSPPLQCGKDKENAANVKYSTVEELATHLK